VIHSKNYRLPVFAKTLLKIEILWEEMPLALFATHLKAGLEQEPRRVAEIEAILSCLQSLEDRPHLLVGDLNTLHPTDQPNISAYLASATWEKRKELSEDELPRQTIPFLLKAGYIDCYRALHPTAPGYTCQSTNPALRIDYIFASPLLVRHLHECDVVTGGDTEMASDHYPIWAEFN
jgi:exodeoxyribonuclease III